MSKIYTRTVSDGASISDDSDAGLDEFCLIAHVHLRARNVEDAMLRLARYFDMHDHENAEAIFTGGQMTVGAASRVHVSFPSSEAIN